MQTRQGHEREDDIIDVENKKLFHLIRQNKSICIHGDKGNKATNEITLHYFKCVLSFLFFLFVKSVVFTNEANKKDCVKLQNSRPFSFHSAFFLD